MRDSAVMWRLCADGMRLSHHMLVVTWLLNHVENLVLKTQSKNVALFTHSSLLVNDYLILVKY